MSRPVAYIALQQFGESDPHPKQLLLDAGFDVRQNPLGRRLTREEVIELLREADGVLAGLEPYDADVLAALPKLRCISRCGVGTDSIDLDAAQRRSIIIHTTPQEIIDPVAELTVAMILALSRHLPTHLAEMRRSEWKKRTGWLLSEWTIGLIGFGRIGQGVERLLRPFAPRVLIADPQRPRVIPVGCELVELSALLPRCDLVSLHVSRPKSLGPVLGANELGAMKAGGRLVNTARGYLVDEQALHGALVSGQVSAAALDVFDAEPYTGPLAQLPQVICTPHIGSMTHASRMAMERRCAQNLIEALAVSGR